MPTSSARTDIGNIFERLAGIERRLSIIESRLEVGLGNRHELPLPESTPEDAEHREEELENRIGENWFPRVGIMVLVIGVAFLLTFPYQGLPSVLPSLFGYLVVGGALMLSRRWWNSLPQISRYVLGGALVLLYFTTLRLYFFSTDPPIADRNIELVLLLLVVVIVMVTALRTRSQFLAGIGLTFGSITALIGAEPWIVVPLSTVLALVTVVIVRERRWLSLLLFGTVLTYLTHLLWVLNNPVLGNAITLVPFSPWTVLPLLLYAVIYAAGILFREPATEEEGIVIGNSFVNGLGAGALYLVITVARSGDALALYQSVASVLFLSIAVAFWKREESRYSTFFYAMLGYMSMSVAMIAGFNRPDYFVWLAWQSLFVVSTAVWFRSQFIVIANFAIYLILFASYAALVDTVHVVSLSFGVVAIASARILNWQKERLELKTEMMRNAYLACAFFIFPFALYHALPKGYVSISWVIVALFYYAMSILVKSRKYRWMAFLTLLLTFGHVLFVDSVSLEPTYRIISFLVLGSVLFLISLKYAKKKARGASGEARNERHS
jgi:uncharacterized membrane protein